MMSIARFADGVDDWYTSDLENVLEAVRQEVSNCRFPKSAFTSESPAQILEIFESHEPEIIDFLARELFSKDPSEDADESTSEDPDPIEFADSSSEDEEEDEEKYQEKRLAELIGEYARRIRRFELLLKNMERELELREKRKGHQKTSDEPVDGDGDDKKEGEGQSSSSGSSGEQQSRGEEGSGQDPGTSTSSNDEFGQEDSSFRQRSTPVGKAEKPVRRKTASTSSPYSLDDSAHKRRQQQQQQRRPDSLSLHEPALNNPQLDRTPTPIMVLPGCAPSPQQMQRQGQQQQYYQQQHQYQQPNQQQQQYYLQQYPQHQQPQQQQQQQRVHQIPAITLNPPAEDSILVRMTEQPDPYRPHPEHQVPDEYVPVGADEKAKEIYSETIAILIQDPDGLGLGGRRQSGSSSGSSATTVKTAIHRQLGNMNIADERMEVDDRSQDFAGEQLRPFVDEQTSSANTSVGSSGANTSTSSVASSSSSSRPSTSSASNFRPFTFNFSPDRRHLVTESSRQSAEQDLDSSAERASDSDDLSNA